MLQIAFFSPINYVHSQRKYILYFTSMFYISEEHLGSVIQGIPGLNNAKP